MGNKKVAISEKSTLGYRSANKDRRKKFHVQQKQAREAIKRDERLRRKREEDKNPELRQERLKLNKPHTIDSKRKWDEATGTDGDDMLGVAVDLEQLSKKRKQEELKQQDEEVTDFDGFEDDNDDDDDDDNESVDSMLDVSEDDEEDEEPQDIDDAESHRNREQSLTSSVTSTKLEFTPESLIATFPSIFNPPEHPKILITTSLNSNLHKEAEVLETIFPNSAYVRRTAHRFGYKYSVREMAEYASNRNFTALIILMEDLKKPCGLDVVHLPAGKNSLNCMTCFAHGF
jgi:ribosome production factor 1